MVSNFCRSPHSSTLSVHKEFYFPFFSDTLIRFSDVMLVVSLLRHHCRQNIGTGSFRSIRSYFRFHPKKIVLFTMRIDKHSLHYFHSNDILNWDIIHVHFQAAVSFRNRDKTKFHMNTFRALLLRYKTFQADFDHDNSDYSIKCCLLLCINLHQHQAHFR